MTRAEKKAELENLLDKLSDEQFEELYLMVEYLASDKTFFDIAPQHVRDGIARGIADLEAGRVSSFEDVMSKIEAKIKARDV